MMNILERFVVAPFKRFIHTWRVALTDCCLDPDCDGTMIAYDNRVRNDTCFTCKRTWTMIECDLKGKSAEKTKRPAPCL